MSEAAPRYTGASRRQFLKATTTAFAGSALAGLTVPAVHAAGDDTIKVALVGCGARGAAAAVQALNTAGRVQLWAMADAFPDRLEFCLRNLQRGFAAGYDRDATEGFGDRATVPAERQFVGLDAYRRAIDSGVDVVLLVEPPGFRPKHFEYAVHAGKHVFMEKPVATDVAGVRRILSANEEAKRKGLKVAVGLQRHHQPHYQEAIQRVHDGAIGEIMALRCYWNGGPPAKTPVPRNGLTELEYQVRNWYFFAWLSGDHICEQHVHNLDICNWVRGAHPVQAQGQGGRQVRVGKEYGDIFDHHTVEFTYPDGSKMWSQCRQMPGCWNQVSEAAIGTQGILELNAARAEITGNGSNDWRPPRNRAGRTKSAYQVEHNVLFDAIRNDKPHNEAEYGALSTMTGVLGRLATYSGNIVSWDEAFDSNHSITSEAESWDASPPTEPSNDGRYRVAIPGVTKIV
jgi:myo-inositol 2-dehydrogenase / D-chiro-inositol 1-dehydrogenase